MYQFQLVAVLEQLTGFANIHQQMLRQVTAQSRDIYRIIQAAQVLPPQFSQIVSSIEATVSIAN